MNLTRFFCIALALLPAPLTAEEPANEGIKAIAYMVVEEWKIGSAGSGAAIVIDPKRRNEKDMKAIGDALKNKYLKDERVHIYIYDNDRAAKMRTEHPENGAAAGFYDKHLIGFYEKNSTMKLHRLSFGITAKGVQGKVTDVKYDIP